MSEVGAEDCAFNLGQAENFRRYGKFASANFFHDSIFRGVIRFAGEDSGERLSHSVFGAIWLPALFHPSTKLDPGSVVSDIAVYQPLY